MHLTSFVSLKAQAMHYIRENTHTKKKANHAPTSKTHCIRYVFTYIYFKRYRFRAYKLVMARISVQCIRLTWYTWLGWYKASFGVLGHPFQVFFVFLVVPVNAGVFSPLSLNMSWANKWIIHLIHQLIVYNKAVVVNLALSITLAYNSVYWSRQAAHLCIQNLWSLQAASNISNIPFSVRLCIQNLCELIPSSSVRTPQADTFFQLVHLTWLNLPPL